MTLRALIAALAALLEIPLTATPAAATQPVAVFVGDSYTQAVGEPNRWTTQASTALGWTEVNLGVGGTGYITSITYEGVTYPAYTGRVAEIASHNPDIVVVSGGRNDLWAGTTAISSAATTFLTDLNAALPQARIIVVAPLWHDAPVPQAILDLYVPLTDAAEAVGGCSVNIHDPLQGHPEYTDGGIHPKTAGHTAIATAFLAAMADLLPGSCITPPSGTRPPRPRPTTPPMPGGTR